MIGLHTGDLHIGESYKVIPNEYLDRQATMLQAVFLDIPKKRNVEFIAVTGDVFHTKKPTTEERDLFLDIMLQADKRNAKIVLMPGNHDRVNPTLTNIHAFDLLFRAGKFKRIHVVDQQPEFIRFKGGYVLCIPHGFPIRKYTIKLLNQIQNKKREFVVAFAHGRIEGAVAESGRALKGEALGTLKDVTYFGLGDIHKYQRVSRRVFYCGAPIQNHFGDSLPKGVLIFDTDRPDKPKLEMIPDIMPFVTVQEGEDIPKDAYVRLVGHRTIIAEDLPPNVLKCTTFAELEDTLETREFTTKVNVLKGLSPFLKGKGFDKKDVKKGKQIVRKLVSKRG